MGIGAKIALTIFGLFLTFVLIGALTPESSIRAWGARDSCMELVKAGYRVAAECDRPAEEIRNR
jgi:hypothetical protein